MLVFGRFPPYPSPVLPALASPPPLVEAFLAGRSAITLASYRCDLKHFAFYLGVTSAEEAAQTLVSKSLGEANGLILGYRAELQGKGLAPNTINRRLAALRSLVKFARTLGVIPWTLEVSGLRSGKPYRDTRGPGVTGVRKLLRVAEEATGPKAVRDRTLLRLLYDMALRRGEVVSLDLAHVDVEGSRLWIQGKGFVEREPVTLPEPTAMALKAWMVIRGKDPGPLFLNYDRAGKGRRLTARSVGRIVASLGCKVGIKARPHGLRHTAITEALDATNGNIRSVQRFSRHKDVTVLEYYDDNRRDLAGDVARLVAARV